MEVTSTSAALASAVDEGRRVEGAAALVQADELYRFYRAGDDEVKALRGVSIAIERGEMVVVAGPSGSGKSTLLACLAGLDNPSGGIVRVRGTRISHQPEAVRARLRRANIGLLFQSGNLLDHLTVTGNLRFAQRLSKRTATSSEAPEPETLLAALGMGRRAHAWPNTLSGGESARASLAVALANDPILLIADEPTGELDGETEQSVLRELRARADAGLGVLVASHSSQAKRVADRVVPLRDGRVDS
jgi:putative ABC transport system ATP-binding protein